MNRFQDRAAVITGGGAGIGLATARRIAAEGGRVALLDWSAPDLEHALQALAGEGADCTGVRRDTAALPDCEAGVAAAPERWGRVDFLVANAGVRAF